MNRQYKKSLNFVLNLFDEGSRRKWLENLTLKNQDKAIKWIYNAYTNNPGDSPKNINNHMNP